MPIRLDELAEKIGGRLLGDGSLTVSNALPLQDASDEDLTLLDSVKHVPRFIESRAVAAVVAYEDSEFIQLDSHKSVIAVVDPHAAFIQAIGCLREFVPAAMNGIDRHATIAPSASIAPDVYVGPNATIGPNCEVASGCRLHAGVHLMEGCRIASDCEIFPGSVLYAGTILGSRVVIHANSVLGAYGFGYRMIDGRHVRTAQLGWVEIESDVEIGACTTIDRGTYGPTRIGHGTKLDNHIQIGHNVQVGLHNLMCAQTGIAGSTSTGAYVVLGGQVGVSDHIRLGDHVTASAQTGIAQSLESGEKVMGTPALPSRESTQIWIASQRLPTLRKDLKELKGAVADLQAQLSSPRAKAA